MQNESICSEMMVFRITYRTGRYGYRTLGMWLLQIMNMFARKVQETYLYQQFDRTVRAICGPGSVASGVVKYVSV